MLNRLSRLRTSAIVWLPALAIGCATAHTATPASRGTALTSFNLGADKHPPVAMPPEAEQVRANASAPILSVMTIDEVVYPYVYGYPLYPEGDAARGIAELRKVSGDGARHSQSADEDGVVHVVEELPAIGCRFDGVLDGGQNEVVGSRAAFVPVSLTCHVPAPKALGGAKRPVLGAVSAGAKAEEILKEPTVVENFQGAFHLTSDDFAGGSGTAFFNTTHGQIALVFKDQKLDAVTYYFDPGVAGWLDQRSWVGIL